MHIRGPRIVASLKALQSSHSSAHSLSFGRDKEHSSVSVWIAFNMSDWPPRRDFQTFDRPFRGLAAYFTDWARTSASSGSGGGQSADGAKMFSNPTRQGKN